MNNQSPDQRKGLSNNFIYLLIAAAFILLMFHNFIETKFANVSFSYQLEHLVNLDLIQPEESRKTAVKDNIATFSGKFREKQTDDAKNRFKYLTLLNENHEFVRELEETESEMTDLREKIRDSADLFLHLSGIPIPPGGYVVVDDIYSPLNRADDIVISQLSPKSIVSLTDVQKELSQVKRSPSEVEVAHLGKAVADLIRNFRSPLLGIGIESIKKDLRKIQQEVAQFNALKTDDAVLFTTYAAALQTLERISYTLNGETDHYRLLGLRPVRAFRESAEKNQELLTKLEENQAKFDKAKIDVAQVIWFFNNEELSTNALEKVDPERLNHWYLNAKEEWENFSRNKGGYFKAPDQPINTVLNKTFRSEEQKPEYMGYLFPALIALSVILLLYMLFARQVKGAGTSAMNFGKSPARLIVPKGENRVTFKDVAGVDEALEELHEIVDFLKDPKKFTALGGRIPKGVLCVGPPGTGKTLIAKAVSGEADRPFFTISGSDFVEMFVGVGASRIRDMFEQAKKNAPCIIFMDEIDAVGRHRGAGIGGGHDEREQTLNQLLVEMDGFDTNEGVILMAATNRPDVLDKALLRPGRFDRRVMITLPDIKGRFEILKVHARKIKLDKATNLMDLAKSTPGCSGADLENMLNEAALIGARIGRSAVTQQEIMEARDKVLYGKERRSLELDEQEKKTTAYHESGHAVVGLFVEHGDPIDKVTIIPRGFSLGATMFLPEKNKVSHWKKELIDQLAMIMGGRCAEEIFLDDISSGAQQDIEQATKLARNMVCQWGMSELGAVAYTEQTESGQYLGIQGSHSKQYSEATAQAIDHEVRKLIDDAHKTAHKIIEEHRSVVELMVEGLEKFETLLKEDVILMKEGKWSIEAKTERLKEETERHKPPTPPPPPPKKEKEAEKDSLENPSAPPVFES